MRSAAGWIRLACDGTQPLQGFASAPREACGAGAQPPHTAPRGLDQHLARGLAGFTLMSPWAHGRRFVVDSLRADGLALDAFVAGLDRASVHRAERTAVYLAADPSTVPQALLHNLKLNPVLHRQNVIATVVFHEFPWVAPAERVVLEPMAPNVPRALALARAQGLDVPPVETTWFLMRQTVVPTHGGGMATWRETLFATLSRHAGRVAPFFRMRVNAVVELGTRVQI